MNDTRMIGQKRMWRMLAGEAMHQREYLMLYQDHHEHAWSAATPVQTASGSELHSSVIKPLSMLIDTAVGGAAFSCHSNALVKTILRNADDIVEITSTQRRLVPG